MNIALINQFVPPARAPTGGLLCDLAVALRDHGHHVTVVSSAGRYGRATGIFSKLREYAGFYFRARRTLLTMHPVPDVVISMTTPPFIGLAAVALKKKKGVPFVLWCMDLYPEALVASGLIRKAGWIARVLTWLTRRERTEADAIITLGPDMTALIRASVPDASVQEIPVWSQLKTSPEAEHASKELRRIRGWGDDETVLMYSGNMGRAHRVEEFVELAQRVKDITPRIRLVFCGSGPEKESWKKQGGELFQWVDPVCESELVAHLLSADIHLISQQPEWVGVVVPSKYQAACALGRPVVFAGPAESSIAQWIKKDDTGWVLPPNDIPVMEHIIHELSTSVRVAEKTKRVTVSSFDRDVLVMKLVETIEQVGREY